MPDRRITSPSDPKLTDLTSSLRELGASLEAGGGWPVEQLRLCGEYGVYEWFLGPEVGGQGWSDADVVQGYLELSAACLTTTFIITQRSGACRRIAVSENEAVKRALLPQLLTGETFSTVGISHLTTSRRHLREPVLKAIIDETSVTLSGYAPWVTGSPAADTVVVGATLEDGREVLIVAPMDLPGVKVASPAELIGLTSSHTGAVQFNQVAIPRQWLLDGPVEGVMKRGAGANTGGLQTSTLAIGLASAALGYLEGEAERREDLQSASAAMRGEWAELRSDLLHAAEGNPVCSPEQLRLRANSLALRSTQAALSAAKGAGYVVGHPVGRWCREALFFLVWSCPQAVVSANLCELAGLS